MAKVVVAMSPKESLRLPTGQAGGIGEKKKIVVAMSGGLDSSVAAALLKRAGFAVIGVFMKLADLPRFREAEKRAKKVAKILGIPFLSLDLRKEFKKKIIDSFLDGYKKGLTPNPCVVCNKEIKFGLLLEKALALDADFIATGHYAKKQKIENRKQKIEYKLLKAKDKNKDQSYFLWMLNQKQLKRTLFPIGDYTRKEVENLARKFKLPVLKAKKSVEICFVKTTINPHTKDKQLKNYGKFPLNFGVGVNDFLTRYLKQKPGPVVEQVHYGVNQIIGKHNGLWFYTIGQRKGIGLPGGPYYVLDKDLKKNLLIVTKNEKDLLKKELICKNVNWMSGIEPKLPLKIKAKIRYRHLASPATIYHPEGKPSASYGAGLKSNIYHLKFEKSQRAITPGQSIVFYLPTETGAKAGKGQEVLGGGIIC